MSSLSIAVPDYYRQPREAKRFSEFTDLFDAREHGNIGLWELTSAQPIPQRDSITILRDRAVAPLLFAMREKFRQTGRNPVSEAIRLGDDDYWISPRLEDGFRGMFHVQHLLSRFWGKNVLTDNGATSMLKNLYNNAGSTIAVMNQLAITTAGAATALTTALTNGQTAVVSLAVNALPTGSSIASGGQVIIGYGTGQTQTVTTSSITNAGGTSIATVSFTANSAYAIGSNVVAVPTVTDNPSSLSGTSVYSGALAGGAFVFSGTGAQNRQVVITYLFGTGNTAGNYTEIWTCNANPVVAGATANHLINPPQTINSTTTYTATVTEKI